MPNRDLGFSLLVRSVPSSLAGLISSALTSRLRRPPTTFYISAIRRVWKAGGENNMTELNWTLDDHAADTSLPG